MEQQTSRFFAENIAGKNNEIYDYSPVIVETGDLTRLSGIDVAINSIRNLSISNLDSLSGVTAFLASKEWQEDQQVQSAIERLGLKSSVNNSVKFVENILRNYYLPTLMSLKK